MNHTSPPVQPHSVAGDRTPSYRDAQLNKLMKELRADVRTNPIAKRALEQAEKRLRYVLRIVEGWDAHHAARAEELLQLGRVEAANGSATMIFDAELRRDLYARTSIGMDRDAATRIAESQALGREVLL